MLLLSMTLLLFGLPAVPSPMTPLVGRLAPAGPIALLETMLLLLPSGSVLVLNRIVPLAAATVPVDEPNTAQFVTVSLVAPLMNRIVLAVAPLLVLEIVREFPVAFKPLIVTLSAPARSISGAARLPVTVRAPLGVTVRLVHVLTEG